MSMEIVPDRIEELSKESNTTSPREIIQEEVLIFSRSINFCSNKFFQDF